ncbi:MAG TPA: response regulator transcription factor [Anaeromyxobacteraceae bacterium]|nr:response regulator transcription factor [Anaeromyxobacteraceae bacterium]
MRILLAEDDSMLGEGVWQLLRRQGHAVDWVKDGLAAERALLGGAPYELVLLDLGLPGKSGKEVLADLRRDDEHVPVLILTAQGTYRGRVAALDDEADDYLVKPFDLDELTARIQALHRRNSARAEPVIEHGRLTLNPATHEVVLNGAPVNLSAREFVVLHALLEQPGRPLSRSRLEERLDGWGEIESNLVEVHVHALRNKLGAEWIKTLRGVGYMVPRLAPENSREPAAHTPS